MSSLLQTLFGLLIPVKLNIVSSLSLLFRITLLFRTTKWFTSIHNSHWNRSFNFQYCFKNVLCVLSFNVNLISVVKIVQDANCVVVFDVFYKTSPWRRQLKRVDYIMACLLWNHFLIHPNVLKSHFLQILPFGINV